MREPSIPPAVFKLRPSRRLIMQEYFKVRSMGQTVSVIRVIANNLNYSITNGKNSFIERVIREFLKNKH